MQQQDDQGIVYWCSHLFTDTEPNSSPCKDFKDDFENCGQCPFMEKQNYTLATNNERFKEYT